MTTLATGAAHPPDATASASRPHRRQRLTALGADAAVLVAAEVIAGVLAILYLVARTDRGRLDIGDGDAAVALAIVAAIVPAWLAWQTLAVLDDAAGGATPGQQRAGLRLEAPSVRQRIVRLALDPRGAIGWLWLAFVATLAKLPIVAPALVIVALIVSAFALASAVLWLVRPEAPSVHDRIARTRLVRR